MAPNRVAFALNPLRHILLLIVVISVSGIHLVVMQAGAWAMMLHDEKSEGSAHSLSFLAVQFISGSKPCQRCLITTKVASLQSHPGTGDDMTFSLDIKEQRLAPVDLQSVRLFFPTPELKPILFPRLQRTGIGATGPFTPPPERGTRLFLG